MMKRKSLLCGALALIGAVAAWAEPVSSDAAASAVKAWVASKARLGWRTGAAVSGVRTCSPTNGVSFHVVKLEGGGFVVTSSDTETEPILAFSESGDLVESEKNPLWTLLRRDLSARGTSACRRSLQATSSAPSGRRGALAASSVNAVSAAAGKWARLLPQKSTNGLLRVTQASLGQTTLGDIRVAPLLQTKWSQEQDSYYSNLGDPCYNYCTPSNYPCGCVATAGAQIMRYHRFPTMSVEPGTYACGIETGRDWISPFSYYPVYSDLELTMQGGVYDWDAMPLVPADGTTLAQRQAIGKLTSDVGIACLMAYGEGGSSASGYMLARCLPERFGYASAVAACEHELSMTLVRKALISNLDAKLPVVLGLDGFEGGHAVVADGYGYSLSTFYVHINMGFAGTEDAWYAPPDISDYTVIDLMVYNIYPEGQTNGVICSGRVLSSSGSPIVGERVTATGSMPVSATTDAQGIYAFILAPGSYVISSGGASQAVTLRANVETAIADNGLYYVMPKPEVNNVCGLDLIESGESSTGATHTVTFDLGDHGTWTGGGMLSQTVADGTAAVEPTFDVAEGWTFMGWSCVFTNVTSDVVVTAQYEALPTGVRAGAWTTDVNAVKEANDCQLIVVLCANYGGCGWSQRAQPIFESEDFLSWAASNGVYLVTSDESRLPSGCADADDASDWFWTLYWSVTHPDGYVYYPSIAIVSPTNFNQAVGYDVVRDDGQNTVGGLVYQGTVRSLIVGLSNYLSVTPDPTPDPAPTPEPDPTPDPAPTPEPDPTPVVTNSIADHTEIAETTVDATVANGFDGILCDGDTLAGTIQVKLAKGNKKTGLAKLTATITPVGGKKTTASGNFNPEDGTFSAKAKDGTALELVIGADGFYGTFGAYDIEGARNLYSSKDDEDKQTVADADTWIGSYALVHETETGNDILAISIAKKGKVKVSGTLADGTTVSASAQMIVGAERCCIPVVYAKKTVSLAFAIWLPGDAESSPRQNVEITGLDGAIFGKAGNLAASSSFSLDVASLVSGLSSSTTTVLSDYLPDGAEIAPAGTKWIVMPDESGKAMKAGKIAVVKTTGEVDANPKKSKIDGCNVSGLKLTFTAKTGAFKGSFKVYTTVRKDSSRGSTYSVKSVSATVSGVVVGGVGYGTATIKKVGSFAVRIE